MIQSPLQGPLPSLPHSPPPLAERYGRAEMDETSSGQRSVRMPSTTNPLFAASIAGPDTKDCWRRIVRLLFCHEMHGCTLRIPARSRGLAAMLLLISVMLIGTIPPSAARGAEKAWKERLASNGIGAEFEVAAIYSGNSLFLAWQEHIHSSVSVKIAHIDGSDSTTITGSSRLVEAYEPSLHEYGSHIIAAWYEGSGNRYAIRVTIFDRQLQMMGTTLLRDDACSLRNPGFVAQGGPTLVAIATNCRQQGDALHIYELDIASDGSVSPRLDTRIAGDFSETWHHTAIRTTDGIIVTVGEGASQEYGISLYKIENKNAKLLSRVAQDEFRPDYPNLVHLENKIYMFWWSNNRNGIHRIEAARLDPERLTREQEIILREGPFEAIAVTPTEHAGRIAVSWCDNSTGFHEIYFLSLGQDLQSDPYPEMLSSVKRYSCIPAVASNNRCLAAGWNATESDDQPYDFAASRIRVVERCD